MLNWPSKETPKRGRFKKHRPPTKIVDTNLRRQFEDVVGSGHDDFELELDQRFDLDKV
jgi:hypothetical protein